MVRPNKNWQRKYGKQEQQQRTLLSGSDDVLSAAQKLACGNTEAHGIILRALRHDDSPVMRLLDMDSMHLTGDKIVAAYKGWAGSDPAKFIKGVRDREIKP